MSYIVVGILCMAFGAVSGSIMMIYKCGNILEERENERNKFKAYYFWLEKWLEKKENGTLSFERLENEKIKDIAIYGQGKIGKRIEAGLEKAGFKVIYFIDEYADNERREKELYTFRDEWPAVDLVIVTVPNEYEAIKEKINRKDCRMKVISFEELV